MSLENPLAPELIALWDQTDFDADIEYFWPHSAYVRETTAYLFTWYGGIYQVEFNGESGEIENWDWIWYHAERGDVQNNSPYGYFNCDPWPDPPLSKRPFSHSGWLTDDGEYLLASDEHPLGQEDCQGNFAPLLRIFDVDDFGIPEAEPVNAFDIVWDAETQSDMYIFGAENIDLLGDRTFCPTGDCIIPMADQAEFPRPDWPKPNHFELGMHNVLVKGRLAFMSWWSRCLQILDITDINDMTHAGCLDHGTGADGDWGGEAFGVYPYSPDGYIYVSGNGLYICRYGYTGELAGNTTWRGDVYVYETLTVPANRTLTIQAGTKVHMFPGSTVAIDGTLMAEGTSSDSIWFFALGPNPQPGDWPGIHFSQYSDGSLAYCSIRNAVKGLQIDNYATVSASHSLIRDCSIAGIYCYRGDLTVDYARIDNNGIYGIYTYIAENTITNSLLFSNGEYGIYLEGSYGWSNVLNSTIDCLGEPTQAGIMIRNTDVVHVEGTEIQNYENSIICYNSDAEIADCNFSINEVAVYSQQYSCPEIRWCVTSGSHIGIKTCTYASAEAGRVSDWGWCSFGFPYPVNNGYYIYHAAGPGQMSPDTLWAQYNWFSTPTPDPGKFFAGAPNVIMWRPYLTGSPPPKRDPTAGGPSQSFSVAQNYPNPFNPQTEIHFSLERPAFTTVTVYNIMGQQIATLASTDMEIGEHAVLWDGHDDHGSPVSSGVYFYVIQAGERFESRKMVMVR